MTWTQIGFLGFWIFMMLLIWAMVHGGTRGDD